MSSWPKSEFFFWSQNVLSYLKQYHVDVIVNNLHAESFCVSFNILTFLVVCMLDQSNLLIPGWESIYNCSWRTSKVLPVISQICTGCLFLVFQSESLMGEGSVGWNLSDALTCSQLYTIKSSARTLPFLSACVPPQQRHSRHLPYHTIPTTHWTLRPHPVCVSPDTLPRFLPGRMYKGYQLSL